MKKIQIKANGINNLTDARYFAARGADWLSFDQDEKSEQYIDPTKFLAITGWVEGPKTIANFGKQTVQEIKDLKKLLDFDVAQVGGNFSIEEIMALEGMQIQKTIVMTPGTDMEKFEEELYPFHSLVSSFVLDFQKYKLPWSELIADPPFSIKRLKAFCQNSQVILDIPFEANEMESIISEMNPVGLCVAGGSEEKIGMKSYEELDDVFDLLEEMV